MIHCSKRAENTSYLSCWIIGDINFDKIFKRNQVQNP